MDIAVLSDIHSNHAALRTCIDNAVKREIKHFIFLGDYISDCPYPQKTMEILYELNEKYTCRFIRGNREEYMLDYRSNGEKGWYYCSSCGTLLYTYENLTRKDFDFFEGLDIKGKLSPLNLPEIKFCHGSPVRTRELLYEGMDNTNEVLNNLDTDLLICGHTHKQGTYIYGNKKLINPGAVGIPWDYDGKAQFAIIHGENGAWQEEYIQLEYDVNSVLIECRDSGLEAKAPMWTVMVEDTLKTGIDVSTPVLERAKELCRLKTGEAIWPDIPERFWEQAVNEKGITWSWQTA